MITALFCHPERRAEVRFGRLKQEGNDFVKKGQYQEALGKYTECLTLKPKECPLYTNRSDTPSPHGSSVKLLHNSFRLQNSNKVIHYPRLAAAGHRLELC